MKPARKRAQAIAQGRGRGDSLVIPLAFEVAARISARPPDEFREDPTQLANGLGELQQALGADGIVCALAGGMELASAAGAGLAIDALAGRGPVAASLEACRRLRAVHGDAVALLVGLTGPATLARQFGVDVASAAAGFGALLKVFCEAGADVLLAIEDEGADCADEAWQDGVRTAANIARFHHASLLGWQLAGLPGPARVPLEAPVAAPPGIVTTADFVAADADLGSLARWVASLRGSAA